MPGGAGAIRAPALLARRIASAWHPSKPPTALTLDLVKFLNSNDLRPCRYPHLGSSTAKLVNERGDLVQPAALLLAGDHRFGLDEGGQPGQPGVAQLARFNLCGAARQRAWTQLRGQQRQSQYRKVDVSTACCSVWRMQADVSTKPCSGLPSFCAVNNHQTAHPPMKYQVDGALVVLWPSQ